MAREIYIGQQSRSLKFTAKGLLAVKSWMPGNIGVREALALHHDTPTVGICIAGALLHEDKKITPGRVLGWIDAELKRFPEFAAAVLLAAEDYYREAGIIEADEGEGKAPALAASAPSTSGPTSSGSPGGTG
jgi:hypothetical protein